MILKQQRVIGLVVLLLVFSISQLYVAASLTAGSTQTQNPSTSAVPMVGRLEVHAGRHILVDNNDAESGSTILDGQTLETSDCKSVTVHLLPVGFMGSGVKEMGQIELATNTKALINYSAGKVKVTLVRGCARVQMSAAIETTIDTPNGFSTPAVQRGTPDLKFAEVCFPSNEKRDYRPACVAPVVWGVVGGSAAGITALALVSSCTRGLDPSTNLPTGPCQ